MQMEKKVFFSSNITSIQKISTAVSSKRKTILYVQSYRHHFKVKLGGNGVDWERNPIVGSEVLIYLKMSTHFIDTSFSLRFGSVPIVVVFFFLVGGGCRGFINPSTTPNRNDKEIVLTKINV